MRPVAELQQQQYASAAMSASVVTLAVTASGVSPRAAGPVFRGPLAGPVETISETPVDETGR